MKYAEIDPPAWASVLDGLRDELRSSASLEEAADATAERLVRTFPETTALARVYALLPQRDLPRDIASFVENVVREKSPGSLSAETPVLTLLGSRGARVDWCDRRRSEGHKGIPLLSASFVDGIPMIARLLSELGIDLAWLDEATDVDARRLVGGFNGVFHVDNATTARDELGRHVIPAQDFVISERIRSVFGMGGYYPDGTLVVVVVFTREDVSRTQAERLKSLVTTLKGETFGLVRSRRLFAREIGRRQAG